MSATKTHSAHRQESTRHKPNKLWWLLGVILLLVFLTVQLPAAWLVARFAPNQQYLENITGNLWRGQAQWRLPTQTQAPVSGSLDWQFKPWSVLLLRAGSDIHISTGETNLKAAVLMGRSSWRIHDMTGTVAASTIKALAPISFPNSPVEIKQLTLNNQSGAWTKAQGAMTWAGGELGVSANGKMETANLPAMKADITLEKDKKDASKGGKLHFALVNMNDERMGDIYLDSDNMLDVQLTHRLLLNVNGYNGNAAMDTAVVSVRQPLATVGQ